MTLTTIKKAGLDELALDHVFTVGASGTDHYTFQGEGLNGTVNDPTLYLTRGKTYRFEKGSAHPLRIQSTSGSSGTAYNTGVTNNGGTGTVIIEVQHDAPDTLYYQCTSHPNMNGIIYVTGALSDGGVTEAKIANNAVTANKIASSAVTSAKLFDASVSESKLGSSVVTTSKIADSAVTGAKIADNTIGHTKIINGHIGTAKLADEAVTLAKLEHGTSSNDGKFLRANNGADPTFETVSSVGGATGADFNDNVKLRFGTTDHDLEIYHDGSNSYVRDSGTGNLRFPTSKAEFRNNGDTQTLAAFIDGGACELYHNDTKKFETTSTGADIINTTSPLTSPSSSGDNLVISDDGNTGITLYTTSTNATQALWFGDTDDADVGSIRYLHGNNQIRLHLNANSTPVMQFNSDLTIIFQNTIYSNGAAYSTGSDLRMKSNLVQFTNTLDDLKKITGYKFDIKNSTTGTTRKSAGLIAQEVEKVYPDFVDTNPETGMKSLEYNTFIGVLVEAVKELTGRVEKLESM